MIQLEDDEIDLMGLLAALDYEANYEDPVLLSLSRRGLVLITSGKRVIITERGIDWLDDHGWAYGGDAGRVGNIGGSGTNTVWSRLHLHNEG